MRTNNLLTTLNLATLDNSNRDKYRNQELIDNPIYRSGVIDGIKYAIKIIEEIRENKYK